LDDSSGAINITVTGGTGSYSYTWTKGNDTTTVAKTADISNLPGGTYTATVKDSLGCEASKPILVFKKSFDVSSQVTQPLCHGDTIGAISLTPSGGVAPYTYVWTNDSTTSSITGLAEGTYKV